MEEEPDYWDTIEMSNTGAKYRGASGSILNGGGRRSYEDYPIYLINSIEKELAERQNMAYDDTNKSGWDLKKNRTKPKNKNPYYNTKIDSKDSINDIYGILNAYGAMDILFGSNGWVIFRVRVKSKILVIRKLRPANANINVAMRYLYWNIKSQLEAITSGMETEENIWLMDTIIRLPNGSYTTIGKKASQDYNALPSG